MLGEKGLEGKNEEGWDGCLSHAYIVDLSVPTCERCVSNV